MAAVGSSSPSLEWMANCPSLQRLSVVTAETLTPSSFSLWVLATVIDDQSRPLRHIQCALIVLHSADRFKSGATRRRQADASSRAHWWGWNGHIVRRKRRARPSLSSCLRPSKFTDCISVIHFCNPAVSYMPILLDPIFFHPVRQCLVVSEPNQFRRFTLVATRFHNCPFQVMGRYILYYLF